METTKARKYNGIARDLLTHALRDGIPPERLAGAVGVSVDRVGELAAGREPFSADGRRQLALAMQHVPTLAVLARRVLRQIEAEAAYLSRFEHRPDGAPAIAASVWAGWRPRSRTAGP